MRWPVALHPSQRPGVADGRINGNPLGQPVLLLLELGRGFTLHAQRLPVLDAQVGQHHAPDAALRAVHLELGVGRAAREVVGVAKVAQ